MPSVLLLCEYPTLNGGEQSMLATLPGLRAAGFSPAVLCPSDGPLVEALRAESVETIAFNCCDADGVRRRSRACAKSLPA